MPKKACCCGGQLPTFGSCCRPIYSGCVNKTYLFSFKLTGKFPCFSNSYVDKFYQCQSNPNITHNIVGDEETFEINIIHKIPHEASINGLGFYIPPNPTGFDGVYGCPGYNYSYSCSNNFNPNNTETYPALRPPSTRCDCFKTNYAYCMFPKDKLKTECNCDTNTVPWLFDCNPGPNNFPGSLWYWDQASPPCGYAPGFGIPFPYTVIQQGRPGTDFWSGCYHSYVLQRTLDSNFTTIGTPPNDGCTFSPGDKNLSNIPNSYSIQFIPNSSQEQNNPNYKPRLQPTLLNFTFICDSTERYLGPTVQGYTINVELGVGYYHEFDCGTLDNPIIEKIDIPFTITTDFFDQKFNDGVYINQFYNRESITNDPMDICVPPSTQLYSNSFCSQSCDNNIKYKDEYSDCKTGAGAVYAGTELNGILTGFGEPNINITKYCYDSIILGDSLSVRCPYMKVSNKIQVMEI